MLQGAPLIHLYPRHIPDVPSGLLLFYLLEVLSSSTVRIYPVLYMYVLFVGGAEASML
jgi:hypothetical protein